MTTVRRLLLTLGLLVCALGLLVWATGGVSAHLFGVRLSARDPARPLVAGVGLIFLYGLWSRSNVRADAIWLWSWTNARADVLWRDEKFERVAPVLVQICGAVLAAIGVLHGTYTASGADSYGYLSQADLWVRRSLVQVEPLALRFTWPNVDSIFSPLGYRPGLVAHTIVPTYSPGLPLLMAAARVLVGVCGPYLVVPASAIVLVWATYALARPILSARASASAAILVATATIVIHQTMLPMTDVPVAAAWTVTMTLAARGRLRHLCASGLAAGTAILIRPNLAPLVVVPLAALLLQAGEPVGARLRRAALFAPGVLLGVASLALLNQYLYGSPLRTGYEGAAQLFSWSNIPFNAVHYTERLMLTASPVVLLGVIPLVTPVFRQSGRCPGARLLVYGTIVVTFAVYLPFARFGEWWYLRFLLPAYPPLYIAFCGGASRVLAGFSRKTRLVAGWVGLVCLVGLGLERSVSLGAFALQRNEARYRAVARWVDEQLPANALILSEQHSGSIRYYARRSTLRYDQIKSLPAVIDDLARAGYHPYLLIEDWERPEFTTRFHGVGFERLSWQPLARMPQPVPLAVYDLLNRASQDRPFDIPEVTPTCGEGR